MLPTRLLLIHPHLSSGLYKRGLDRGVGVLLQGGQLPRQPGEIAGRVPGYVLRVLWSHLASPPDEGFHSAKLSRLRTPRSVEISPSMAERDLLTSEPALIGSRVLTDPTARSINSRGVCPSGQDSTNLSSCLRYSSSSERSPPFRRRSSSRRRSLSRSSLRSSSPIRSRRSCIELTSPSVCATRVSVRLASSLSYLPNILRPQGAT